MFPSTQQIAREIGLPSTKCCLNQEVDIFVRLGLKLTSCITAALVNMKIPSGEMLSLLFRVFLTENVEPKAAQNNHCLGSQRFCKES